MLSCRGSRTHACPGCCVLTEIVGKDNCSSKSCDKRTPSRRLMTMCRRFVKAKISDFRSQPAEHLHLRLSFNKTWKVIGFYEHSKQPLCCYGFLRPDWWALFFFFCSPFNGASASLLEGLGFFISGKRAGKDREDEWHQWPADTSRDVWLRQMSLVTLVGILNPAAQRSTAR